MASKAPKTPENRADRLYRALQRANENGITLLLESDSEAWFATSASQPGVIHAVSERGCSCQGYRSFSVCQHFALFIDKMGKRPPTAAELEEALDTAAEWEERARTGLLKSTADFRAQLTARHRAERLLDLAAAEAPIPFPTITSAADDLPPAA